ncbi:MAG: DNA primase [Planctomycetes bacterium]|nr:DNA primase [Planctomycetota bacterium]
MPFISQESVLEVKRAVDIVEVVSSCFPLKKKGGSYWACCPFHDEKTPSFHVHPERQMFKCFGCGKAGGVIDFVMEHEKVEYPEALRILAQRAGIQLKFEGGARPGIGKEEILKANEWAAKHFRRLFLTAPEAESARKYLASRGVNDETCETFQIGFAPDSWDHLLKRAAQSGIGEKILHAAGLAVERSSGGGYYDRFRGRLVLPICDPRGRVIGFGARTLKDEEPKYLNTPETATFSKGRNFFGLNLIRDEIERSRTLYIVEGYFDVILPFQAGLRGLVATLGTALTRDHLRLLRRYDVEKVVLVFDGDKAGQEANVRGMDLLLSENVDIFVSELPEGNDPADCVVRFGADRTRECIEKRTEIFDFMLKAASARVDLSTPSGKTRVVEETLDRLAQVPDPVKREVLLQQLARRFALDVGVLRGRLQPGAAAPIAPAAAKGRKEPAEAAAEELLALLLAEPGHVAAVRTLLPPDGYPTELTRGLAARLYDWDGPVGDLVSVLEAPAERALAADLAMREFEKESVERRIQGCLETLQRRRFLNERKGGPPGGDPDEALRRLAEARKARPSDHGLMPGR